MSGSRRVWLSRFTFASSFNFHPMFIALVGLPLSGKDAVADWLVKNKDFTRVSIDQVSFFSLFVERRRKANETKLNFPFIPSSSFLPSSSQQRNLRSALHR